MLLRLAIRDLAIIDELELAFAAGMTVLTGETGAGKSILIDALGLVLGDRADAGVIRHGQNQAEITASFDISGRDPVLRWLDEQSIRHDDEVVLRRILGSDGRSRAYINGSTVPLASLRELGAQLVDIHGQHEHQRLLSTNVQRQWLDTIGRHEPLLKTLRERHRAWLEARDQLQQLEQALGDRDARLDILRFQVGELDAAGVEGLDVAALEQRHRRAANAAEIINLSAAIAALLDDDEDGAGSRLGSAVDRMARMVQLDATLAPLAENLNEQLAAVQDLAGELRRYGERIDIDGEELAELDARLASLHQLARKHRVAMDELPARHAVLKAELAQLDQGEQGLAQLQQAVTAARAGWQAAAAELSKARARAAKSLGEQVSKLMAELGMGGGRFAVQLSAREGEEPHPDGAERVELMVSANPGQPLKPLAKVASGGELARISLAIQVVAGKDADLPCLIFDEVDVGIGGGTAEVVGRLLRKLGERAQVLCVTHQPQVAALGHGHLRVQKKALKGQTRTEVVELAGEQRIEEIARMVGGLQITDTTRAHAQELLASAEPA